MNKILIVEDEILIQKSLKTLLEKRGAIVDCTGNGSEAISLINQSDYNRIVCDLMLQDISGFDVIEEAKKKYTPEDIANKFIIITAYSSEQVITKAKRYNCIIINKPFKNLGDALNLILESNND